MRHRHGLLVACIIWSVVLYSCQGPATASSVDVTFANMTAEPAFTGWVGGDIASPPVSEFYPLEPCSVNHFGFRAGMTYTIVVRFEGQSQSFVLLAPFAAGIRQDTVTINHAGATYEQGVTYLSATNACPNRTPPAVSPSP